MRCKAVCFCKVCVSKYATILTLAAIALVGTYAVASSEGSAAATGTVYDEAKANCAGGHTNIFCAMLFKGDDLPDANIRVHASSDVVNWVSRWNPRERTYHERDATGTAPNASIVLPRELTDVDGVVQQANWRVIFYLDYCYNIPCPPVHSYSIDWDAIQLHGTQKWTFTP